MCGPHGAGRAGFPVLLASSLAVDLGAQGIPQNWIVGPAAVRYLQRQRRTGAVCFPFSGAGEPAQWIRCYGTECLGIVHSVPIGPLTTRFLGLVTSHKPECEMFRGSECAADEADPRLVRMPEHSPPCPDIGYGSWCPGPWSWPRTPS